MSASTEALEPLVIKRPGTKKREVDANRTWTDRTFSILEPGCVRGSIFTLCSSTIGAGVLSLPYAVWDCGLLLGFLLLILGGLVFGLYYMVLIISSERTRIYSYVGLMESLYGSCWKHFTEVSVIIYSFGLLTAVQAILAEFSMQLFFHLQMVDDTADVHTRMLILLLANAFLLLPACLKPELASLRYLSLISVGSIGFLALVIFLQAPFYISQNKTFWEDIKWVEVGLPVVDTAALIFFAYDATINVPIIYTELQRRSHNRIRKVVVRSMTLLIVFFSMVGVFGYLSYVKNTPELVVGREALPGWEGRDYAMYVAVAFVTLAVVVEVPTTMNPLRLSIQQLAGGTTFVYQPTIYYGATVLLLFMSAGLAILIPSVIFYFKVLGGIFSVFNGFVFPSKHHIAMIYWKTNTKVWKSTLLTLLTLVLAAFGFCCVGLMITK